MKKNNFRNTDLGKSLVGRVLSEAAQDAFQTLEKMLLTNQESKIVDAYLMLGDILSGEESYSDALLVYQHAMTYLYNTPNAFLSFVAYKSAIICCERIGQFALALNYAEALLRLAEESGKKADLLFAYTAVGALYTTCQNYEKSFYFQIKALHLEEQLPNNEINLYIHASIAATYMGINQPEKSLFYFKKAIQHCRPDDARSRVILFSRAAHCHAVLQNHLQVNYCLEQAIGQLPNVKTHYFQAVAFSLLGDVFFELKRYEDAQKYYTRIFLHINNICLIEAKALLNSLKIFLCPDAIHLNFELPSQFASLEELLQYTVELVERMNFTNFKKDIYQYACQFYKEKRNFEQAYLYQEKLLREQPTCSHLQLEAIAQLQVKLELEQKTLNMQKEYAYSLPSLETPHNEQENHSSYDICAPLRNVSELTALHRRRAEQLQQRNEQLKQFAHIAAHDLREPLRNIGSFASILQRRYAKQLPGEAQDFLQQISRHTYKMYQILEELVRYTTLDYINTDKLPPIKFSEALKYTLLLLKPNIGRAEAQIKYEDLPEVYVHQTHLSLLLQNLIDNALKFRHPDRPCHITIGHGRIESNGFCEFWIKDNGIGLENEYREIIFKLFSRLDKVNYEGTGMGLAICHRIVKIYEGDIWVVSEINEGSTFHFTLPTISRVSH